VRILIGLVIFLLGCPPPSGPPREVILQSIEAAAQAGMTLLGEVFLLAPNSTGSFLLQLRDPTTGQPITSGRVDVTLTDPDGGVIPLFSGEPDAQGLLQVTFAVPEGVSNPDQILTIESHTTQGVRRYQQGVYVSRAYNILLSTDKPVYQPGQTIHIRALALDTLALQAAQAQPVTVLITDPSGNKLQRKVLTTSEFGIAGVDFALDNQAQSGDYIISAEIGPVTSSRTVEVKPYTLPRFKIDLATDAPFYLPAAPVTGTVHATYFFGKPVANATVKVRAVAQMFDNSTVVELEGSTDAQGQYTYSFHLPDYFIGQADDATATVKVEVTVIDAANHAETVDQDLTVAQRTLLVDVVPESGNLQPGLPNILYLNSTSPDGRPTPSLLTIRSPLLPAPVDLATDEFGLASFVVTPTAGITPTLYISTTALHGPADSSELTTLTLNADSASSALLLRPERAEYQIGDTMNLDILVGGNIQTVFLDVIKGRQTFALVALPVTAGFAQVAIDIDGSLLGTLELNAYAVTVRGEIVRDRRLVLVNPAPAEVTVTTDATRYRPGDRAQIDIQVTHEGAPLVGALGISIVDESVFAVGAQDPGFARTYFLLERELLEPRYEIHGFTDYGENDTAPDDKFGHAPARELALKGLFAQALVAAHSPGPAQTTPAMSALPATTWAWVNRLALLVPLAALGLYDGTRRRRRWLLFALTCGLLLALLSACATAAVPAPAAQQAASETTATRGNADSPRLRQFFPETLYWAAELATDDQGHVQIEVPVADSITTWRISVLASDAAGNLGSAQSSLPVFQEFFVEPDLPRYLTVDDELSIPVAVYNYLDTPQSVALTVHTADWFELLGPAQLSLEIGPNEVGSVYLPIRVARFGEGTFTVEARGQNVADAIVRTVEVLPNGLARAEVINGRLQTSQTLPIALPPNAIPGTARVTVKLYPGIVAQALDGLEGMLGTPYGCFEQTSSVNYPNILVLDYLRATGRQSPAIELSAQQKLNLGYQRLLQFEVRGTPGGFSLFGDPPPDTMLTAYGLHQFTDMAKVTYVDPQLIERAVAFLLDRQQADGSWDPRGNQIFVGAVSQPAIRTQSQVAETAYVAWALANAGLSAQTDLAQTHDFLTKNLDISTADSYVLAIVTNTYLALGLPADPLLDELATRALPSFGGASHWSSNVTTWLHASGPGVDLETTAMAALAFIESGRNFDLVEQALQYITDRRDQFGAYGTTQATVWALKALVRAAEVGDEGETATITLRLNDGTPQTILIDQASGDAIHQINFDEIGEIGDLGDSGDQPAQLQITLDGRRAVYYQVTTSAYLPWSTGPAPTPSATEQSAQAVQIDVDYDKTELRVNDVVQVTAAIEVLAEGTIGTLLVDLGVPPGFSPVLDDLEQLVTQGIVARYELTGRQIIFYLTDIPSGSVTTLRYGLRARYPIRAQAPQSTAYNYYTPAQQDTVPPQRIIVTLGTPQSNGN
jgi:hypothetical protein